MAGYVSTDGSYGTGNVMLFDENLFTEHNWDVLDSLPDAEKYYYVDALVHGRDVEEFEKWWG